MIGTGGPSGEGVGGERREPEQEIDERAEGADAVERGADEGADLGLRLAQAREQLEASAAELRETRGRVEMLRMLAEARVRDVESASLLVEKELEETVGGSVVDRVREAVSSVRKRKPHLFGWGDARGRGVVMGAGVRRGGSRRLSELAESAVSTGSRSSLMEYLRARRSVS